MVLNWRNSANVKEWMYSQNEISIETHINFIDNLLFSLDSQYAVVKRDGNYLGVVDFTKIDFHKKQCFFGLYSNPFNKVPGVGRVLEEVCLKYTFDLLRLTKIKLEVFENNIAVVNLHKKFNFIKTDIKNVDGKPVIRMELSK